MPPAGSAYKRHALRSPEGSPSQSPPEPGSPQSGGPAGGCGHYTPEVCAAMAAALVLGLHEAGVHEPMCALDGIGEATLEQAVKHAFSWLTGREG